MSRLLVIGFIWLGCTVAWSILGSSLTIRSADTSSARSEEVHGLWGGPLHQQPVQGSYTVESVQEETKTVQREGEQPVMTTVARRVLTSEARNFRLRVTTDFSDVDFPLNSVSPSEHAVNVDGWSGEWSFESLITSSPMGIQMPEKLNPGPLAARITFFAPVSLLFFFFVISMLAITSERELHPMHYFLLGCAFFAFHLLFAYSVDHLALTWSFILSAVVSMLLVITYVRHFVGWRFALEKVAPVQLIYLVLFSASFFWKGFTGLAITIGAILTLFAVMQLTGGLDWTETFAKRTYPRKWAGSSAQTREVS